MANNREAIDATFPVPILTLHPVEKFTVSSIKRALQRPDEDLRQRSEVDEAWRVRRAVRKGRRQVRAVVEPVVVTYWS